MNLNLLFLLLSFVGFQVTNCMEDRATLLQQHTRTCRDHAADVAFTTNFQSLNPELQKLIVQQCVRPFVEEIKKFDLTQLGDYEKVTAAMIKHNNAFIKSGYYRNIWSK